VFDLEAAQRQARSLEHVGHRPWPLPERSWSVGQTLEDVLLAHWPVPIDSVRAHVPAELKVELYDGSAWMSIVPFRAADLRLRGMLPVPGVSSFLELNVRTYVRAADGKPGVWFFSLDVSSRLAAEAARRVYKLPVFHARMSTERSDDWIEVECSRFDERGRVFSGRYRAEGESFTPEPGSLESFLADRFCLYATNERGKLQRAEIHHDPWTLQRVTAEIDLTTISPFGLDGPPLCHFSRRQDVVLWPLAPVR
jgi:uncharacterized protein YqjF (DUF2071 family)